MVSTRLQSTSGGETTVEHIFIGVSPVRVIRNVSTVSSPSHEIVPYSQPSASSTAGLQVYVGSTHFLDLPNECIEKIFSYVGYKQVANMRKVCKQLDRVCSGILNSTFQKLQTQMLHRFQTIKGKMPRRESARRNHPLACESDIIETLHMRLTLLQMSFGKHIERKHICFFAGEILDEVYRILHYIKVTPKLARPYKVTDELFDLSTMAMEYFKEHIEPTLPEIAYFGTDFLDFTGSSNKYLSLDSPPHGACKGDESPLANQSDERPALPQQSNMVLRKRIRKIKQGMRRYNYQLSQVRKELRCCRGKISEQQKQIVEYATRLDEYDKKTEEANRKFSTMLQELNKCKTELQYWRSKSTLSSVCNSCGQIVTPLPDQSDVEALTNQGVVLPDLEPTEQLIPEAGTSSSEDVWHKVCVCRVSHGTAWDFKRKVVDQVEPEASGTLDPKNATEQRNKRKSTDKALATLPNKKQRPSSILTTKTRNKRS